MSAPISISQVTKCVKRNKQTIKITLNTDDRFEQNHEFVVYRDKKNAPADTETSILMANSTNESNTDILYQEHQVIDIPQKLNDIFDNVLGDDYYLFGVDKDISFLMSLLYIISKDFKLKDRKTQHQYCQELKKSLTEELPKYFKDKSYSSHNFNRTQMLDNLENDIYDKPILCYISDYYNLNLIIFDYNKSTYSSGFDYQDSHNNVVIIVNDHVNLPLVHIYGEFPNKFVYKCLVNKFQTSNKVNQINTSQPASAPINEPKSVPVPVPESAPINEPAPAPVVENKPETPKKPIENSSSIKLKALSAYKLKELQDIAGSLKIDINHTIDGKQKNKTKRELYNDIKSHT